MNDEKLKSMIYISKRCPYCRKLLLLLQSKPELKGSIQITSIDDEPFPKIITSVPSMISNGEVWNADELFAALEGRPDSKQMGQQAQNTDHARRDRMQHMQQQQQQQQQQPNMQQQQPNMQQQQQTGDTDELDGYFSGSLGGGSLGFATLDDIPEMDGDNSYYASIDAQDNPVDVQNDGYMSKNKKTEKFDSDYERMMSERGDVGQGSGRMGGGM
jgi:hypothetical protein